MEDNRTRRVLAGIITGDPPQPDPLLGPMMPPGPPHSRFAPSRFSPSQTTGDAMARPADLIERDLTPRQRLAPEHRPFQDFAQANPLDGFAGRGSVDTIANRLAFEECLRSDHGTSVEMKDGWYEFCTYGRLGMTKQHLPTGEPTGLLITPGPNGNEVFARNSVTGAWGGWALAPGQSLTADLDDEGRLVMNIK